MIHDRGFRESVELDAAYFRGGVQSWIDATADEANRAVEEIASAEPDDGGDAAGTDDA